MNASILLNSSFRLEKSNWCNSVLIAPMFISTEFYGNVMLNARLILALDIERHHLWFSNWCVHKQVESGLVSIDFGKEMVVSTSNLNWILLR